VTDPVPATFDHIARECLVCREPQAVFRRPHKSQDPFRCASCGSPERGQLEGDPPPTNGHAGPAPFSWIKELKCNDCGKVGHTNCANGRHVTAPTPAADFSAIPHAYAIGNGDTEPAPPVETVTAHTPYGAAEFVARSATPGPQPTGVIVGEAEAWPPEGWFMAGERTAQHPSGAWIVRTDDGRWTCGPDANNIERHHGYVTSLDVAVRLALSPAPRADGVEVLPGATARLHERIAELEGMLDATRAQYSHLCEASARVARSFSASIAAVEAERDALRRELDAAVELSEKRQQSLVEARSRCFLLAAERDSARRDRVVLIALRDAVTAWRSVPDGVLGLDARANVLAAHDKAREVKS
jgi:hypothetical protein